MSLDNGIIQTIVGDTLEECKQKLFAMYGRDYQIVKRESKFFRTGFLGLRQKEKQVITYTIKNTGVLLNGETQVASGTVITVNGTKIELTVGNTGTATNGQVKITAIEIVYAAA